MSAFQRRRDGAGPPGRDRRSPADVRGAARTAFANPPVIPEGIVTAITEKPRSRGRYLVELEGQRAATVSAEMLVELSLRIGARIDARSASALGEAALRLAVFDKAVSLLAVSARTTRDLRTRLERSGARDADIEATLDRLARLGLVDDAQYARNLARIRVASGGVSKRRVKTELYRRGIASAVADEAIAETIEEVGLDEYGAALAAADRRMRVLRALDRETLRRRLYGFLARRGYEHDVIARVMRDVLRQHDEP